MNKEQEIVKRGEAFKNVIETEGFKFLKEYISQTLNSIRTKMELGISKEDYLKEVGRASGLRIPFQYMETIIKKADEINKRTSTKSKK